MKNIYWFNELSKDNLEQVGGKGANLGEMTGAGFPIPNGFCVSAEAYYNFIKVNNINRVIEEYVTDLDAENTKQLNTTSMVVKNAILRGFIPDDLRQDIIDAYTKMGQNVYVAVRSSATAEDLPEASFAGQQATFLNVTGPADVIQSVKECWASLFEPRSIYYRENQGFGHTNVALSAVIQEMVQSDTAGVAFTVEPIGEDRNIISIEGAYGLGESVVSGSLTPDRYLVNKTNFTIVDKLIAKQTWKMIKVRESNDKVDVQEELQNVQKLSDDQIIELAKMSAKIEQHYGSPQDIEWAFVSNNLYIVQSRPITTLKDINIEPESPTNDASDDNDDTINQGDSTSTELTSDTEILVKGLPASPGIAKGIVRFIPSKEDIHLVQKGDILVTEMTTPDFVPAMKKAAGIVTDAGGSTCHAAIVSRELGIPCIVGSTNATEILKEGMEVTMDATRGIVYKGDIAIEQKKKSVEETHIYTSAPITGTKIYVNLANPDMAEKVANQQVDGIGLCRAEFMLANLGKHPKKMLEDGNREEFVNYLAEGLRKFATAFYPRPVVYRATDFKTNEYKGLEGGDKYEPKEENPMMGYRGAVRYIMDPDVFDMELDAIKQVREKYNLKNLWVMIPFVRRIGELKAVKELMHKKDLYRTKDFKLWIMCEVPSTVLLIDEFCKAGIDGISVGSNDLTQLILGVDRDNAMLANEFDERNSAVLKALKHVAERCEIHGITCSICGQAPSVYPDFAQKLVEFGFTSMSVNPDVINITRRNVASAELKVLLKSARRHKDADNLDWFNHGL